MKDFIVALLIGIVLMIAITCVIIDNSIKYRTEDNVDALAKNCYFEARNSTVEDMIATMIVVINRGEPAVEVYKPNQFSWTQEYKEPADNISYRKCKAIAEMVYNNPDLFKSSKICKHYTSVDKEFGNGHWTKNFKSRTRIGKHWYYC